MSNKANGDIVWIPPDSLSKLWYQKVNFVIV